VNGWSEGRATEFFQDQTRLFVSNQNGTFTERAAALGLDDHGQGRGIVAFDYDHDGDIDLFVSNNQQAPHLWRNDGGNAGHFLDLKLRGLGRNSEAIGGRIYVITGAQTEMRELRAGSNFLSQDPAEAHFGLGAAAAADEVHIMWPDGRVTRMSGVTANRRLRVTEQASTCTADACTGGDPCTTATCVDGACVSEDVTGPASASCVCDRPESAACTNQRLPRGFTTARSKACRALRKASHGKTGKKLQKLCKQASQSWQHAASALGKPKTKAKVAASCVLALTNAVTDASVRADRVAKDSVASSAVR
jgi:hypothetical protein